MNYKCLRHRIEREIINSFNKPKANKPTEKVDEVDYYNFIEKNLLDIWLTDVHFFSAILYGIENFKIVKYNDFIHVKNKLIYSNEYEAIKDLKNSKYFYAIICANEIIADIKKYFKLESKWNGKSYRYKISKK